VVVTTAGNLPANYVIHAAVMGSDLHADADLVRRATLATLRRAEDLKLHSLALPAFGTGVGRLPASVAAEAMVGALRTHLAAVPQSSLQRIHLVLFQDDIFRAFGASLGLRMTGRVG
jgi:O-acetyl-ADP-ribose deacetylase (regulator of RNase III)